MMRRAGEVAFRAALLLLPRSTRAAIRDDLESEATSLGRGGWWCAWQALRVSSRWRSAFGVDALLMDVRYALRSLARARWFTAAAALTCALGIGLSLAVFSVVDRMMFRPLPFGSLEALVQIHRLKNSSRDPRVLLEQALVMEFRRHAVSLEDVAFVSVPAVATHRGDGEPPLALAGATWNLLSTLGIAPAVGTDFSMEDARARRQLVLLTHETWRSRYGGMPSAIGQVVTTGGKRYAIAGVLPPGFILPSSQLRERIDGITLAAVTFEEAASAGEIQTAPIARLRKGVTAVQAQAELNALASALSRRSPESVMGGVATVPIQVHPLRDGMTLLYRPYLLLIVSGVLAVLALACVNLSTLLVARGRLRDRELAVRIALGASRRRLAMATLVESAIVAVLGSVVAWTAVQLAGTFILSFVPPAFRSFAVPATDLRLMAAAVSVALMAALVSALVPARQAAHRDVQGVLQQSTRSGGRGSKAGRALLSLQTALAALLVTAAVVSARSFNGMAFGDQGYQPDGLYAVSTSAGYNRQFRMEPWRDDRGPRAIESLRGLPGVVAIGAATGLPLERAAGSGQFWPREARGWEYGVSAGMMETLGATAIAGRLFTQDELRARAPVAVLSAAGARTLFVDAQPASVVGREFPYTGGAPLTIVGVIADVRRYPGDAGAPLLFVPAGTPGLVPGSSNIYLAVRMAPGHTLDERGVIDRLGRELGPGRVSVEYVPDSFAPFLQRPRFQAALFSALASVALVVAAIGLFALATVDVTSRRYEIGLRMSLGATASDIQRQFIRAAITPVLVGTIGGLIAAFWSARFLQAFLFEVDARGIWTQGQVALILIATAAFAAWLPARQAARVDPAETLRTG